MKFIEFGGELINTSHIWRITKITPEYVNMRDGSRQLFCYSFSIIPISNEDQTLEATVYREKDDDYNLKDQGVYVETKEECYERAVIIYNELLAKIQ